MGKCSKATGMLRNLRVGPRDFKLPHVRFRRSLLPCMLQSPYNITKRIRTPRVERNPDLRRSSSQSRHDQRRFRNLRRRTTSHPTPNKGLSRSRFVGRKKKRSSREKNLSNQTDGDLSKFGDGEMRGNGVGTVQVG